MEANKIKGQALSIVLPNGQEVTYCERGAENKEVLITGAFYFHTVMPVVEALGKKYHVYGIVIVHICAENEAALDRLRGAKYAQSDLTDVFPDVKRRLEVGQQVLFSGTPCQVLGLKAYLRKDYVNLLLVDLVCHSVPSPLAWKKYLEYISGEKTLAHVNLRCKDTGWSRYRYSNRFDFSDGTCQMDRSGESLYMKLFGSGLITRPACANCQFKGYRRVSDLTIGDFWGIWDIAPEMDDNKGTSVVLVQSQRGAELLQSIANRMVLKPVTLEEASRQNGAMLKAAQSNPRRTEAFALIRAGQIGECESWFIPTKQTITQKVRRMVGGIFRRLGRKQ